MHETQVTNIYRHSVMFLDGTSINDYIVVESETILLEILARIPSKNVTE